MRKSDTIQFRILAVLLLATTFCGCLSKTGHGGSGLQTAGGGADPATPNTAPTIYGSPSPAVLVGDVYAFTPSSSDPDNDVLTYSIQAKPAWASFNSATGKLSGQPLLGDIGVYDSIRISVSDGSHNVSLPDFSITVSDSALGAMSLSWNAPTQNADGSLLTNLAGYNIYYGKSRGVYPNRIHINNSSITTYLVENLLPNTYYVVATSFNTLGVESAYSNEAVRIVIAD